ncbi:MAG TPA: c-type cytochrome [Deltaproteobacteria bacterium]|nr:c-type cytochrome [Deltaproteobacteria bacterium]
MPEKIGHSIDGIEEYDNPIPRWLMWLLYVTIAVAVVYWILYPGFWPGITGWNQAKMYEEEMAAAEKMYAAMRPKAGDINALIHDAGAIAEGSRIFAQNCAPCHGAEAKGDTGIGPNLTDAEWIYGGKPEQIVKVITEGTENGMPPWASQLGEAKIAKVAAFVHSLGGGE